MKRLKFLLTILYLLTYFLPFVSRTTVDNGNTSSTLLSGFHYLSLFWVIALLYLALLVWYLWHSSRGLAFLVLGSYLLTCLAAFSEGITQVPPAYLLTYLTHVVHHLAYGYWLNLPAFGLFWWTWYQDLKKSL